MATAPSHASRPSQSQTFYEDNTRAYLQSLQAGQKPDIRPDFGRFEQVVSFVEGAFGRANKDPGNAAKKAIAALCGQKRYADLKKLLDVPMPSTLAEQGEATLLGIPALPGYAQLSPAQAQGACPELDWYTNFSRKASERAYDDYHQFCGLWLFSAIAGRRVSLEIKKKKFYTNLMLSLCGTTSFYAKSFTANVAKQMLYELDLGYTLAPNRITPQKLLSDMAGGHVPTNYNDLDEEKQDRIRFRLGTPGQKGLLFDELGLFIQSMLRKQSTNADFADLLMTFDECPKEYENSTIARGGEPIEKPYLTLLGCMTPANLRQNAKQGADFWQDGFWARFSFVVAPPPPKADDEDSGPPQISDLDDIELPYPPALLESLKAWHERLGIPVCNLEPKTDKKGEPTGAYKVQRGELPEVACSITREAQQAWVNYDYALRQMCLRLGHEDFNGSYVRLAETAMRIAVLLASLSNNNKIELRHWAKAQELTEILRKHLHNLYAQINANDIPMSAQRTIEDKICEVVAKQCEKGEPPNLRNLGQYIKGVAAGVLKSAVIDLVRVGLLAEQKTGKTTRYFPGNNDG